MRKHVAVLMGGWSAEREVSLRLGPGLRRGAGGRGLPRHAASMSGATSRTVLARPEARRRVQRPARALGRGRHRPGHAGDAANPLHPFRRAGLGAGDAEGHAPRRDGGGRRAGAARHGRSTVSKRRKSHVLPPPYVVKPVNEGSSVGVIIVREDAPSAAGADAARTGPSATSAGRELHSRDAS